MKSLIQFISEAYLTEGGHSVEGCEPIRGDLAKPVADEIIKALKTKFKCECSVLGSTGKKGADKTSGDIDIAIEYNWDDYKTVMDFVEKEFNCPIGNINQQLHVFNIGYPYKDNDTTKLVQVDFMFTDSVEFAEFAYHSPDFTKNESKYKGMYQSQLMMSAISTTPAEDILGKEYSPELFTDEYNGKYKGETKTFWKLYFDQNDGLKVEHKTFEGKSKPVSKEKTIKGDGKVITKNLSEIFKLCFGDKAAKQTFNSFESVFTFITSDDYKFKSKEHLELIKEHFLSDWQIKLKTSSELMSEFSNLFDEAIKSL